MKRLARALALTVVIITIPVTASAAGKPLIIKLIDEEGRPLKDQPFQLVDQHGNIVHYETLDDSLFIMQQPAADYSLITGEQEIPLTTADINEINVPTEEAEPLLEEKTTQPDEETSSMLIKIQAVFSDHTVAGGVTIQLLKDDEIIDEVQTDDDGTAVFSNLAAGDYNVQYDEETLDIAAGEEKYFVVPEHGVMETPVETEDKSITASSSPNPQIEQTTVPRTPSVQIQHYKSRNQTIEPKAEKTTDVVSRIISTERKETKQKEIEKPVKSERETAVKDKSAQLPVEKPTVSPGDKEDQLPGKSTTAKTTSKVTRQLPVEKPAVDSNSGSLYSDAGSDDSPSTDDSNNDSSNSINNKRSTGSYSSAGTSTNSSDNSTTDSSKSSASSSDQSLPVTGEHPISIQLAGYITLLIGFTLLFLPKRKDSSSPL
ncbi:prealbumin-like fold domain-containing protein [Macrococcus lamae]|uniref:SpaA-like prealbumin fold domain-containing protein n=1 Tax=Macrococcus lamae TaxID=198484 RepID=A0A4R6BV10_9STAP|nr:prealbumin-like fold domain-containing protein [Macrococcus lamae]TDM12101.1 hypothetical protein ERX29_04605 [Macrococcus lamae]